MNIEKSFSFPFEDKDWAGKLGLGGLIMFVPILNFAWSGYLVEIIRNVMNGVPNPLPTWDDLGRKFNEGLILLGAGLIYGSPILLAFCLPMGILALSGRLEELNNLQRISEAGGALLFCIMCGFALYGLALSAIYPAILILFAREGTFASCFKLQEAFALISRNIGPFLTAWGLSLIVSFGVGLIIGGINAVISMIPCLGWIVGMGVSALSSAYISVVYAHLFAQFGRVAFGQNQIAKIA